MAQVADDLEIQNPSYLTNRDKNYVQHQQIINFIHVIETNLKVISENIGFHRYSIPLYIMTMKYNINKK